MAKTFLLYLLLSATYVAYSTGLYQLDQVELKSEDGMIISMRRQDAELSDVINSRIRNDEDADENVIPVPEVNGIILEKIKKWAQIHNDASDEKEEYLIEQFRNADDLMKAAESLKIGKLKHDIEMNYITMITADGTHQVLKTAGDTFEMWKRKFIHYKKPVIDLSEFPTMHSKIILEFITTNFLSTYKPGYHVKSLYDLIHERAKELKQNPITILQEMIQGWHMFFNKGLDDEMGRILSAELETVSIENIRKNFGVIEKYSPDKLQKVKQENDFILKQVVKFEKAKQTIA